MKSQKRPYVLFVAEKIYLEILKIKKNNPDFSNINAIESFIGTKFYNEISSGEFHDKWFKKIESDGYIDNETKEKIPKETIKLINIQKDIMKKQLIQFLRVNFFEIYKV